VSLKDDRQQNIQMQLDFSPAPTGEARKAGREETESPGVANGLESPASTNRLMELVSQDYRVLASVTTIPPFTASCPFSS
jgi:hypothetical protein